MTDAIDLKKKTGIPLGEKIKDICKPLVCIDVTFFNYLKIWSDGSQIDLHNYPPKTYPAYSSKPLQNKIVEKDIFIWKEEVLLSTNFSSGKLWSVIRNNFNGEYGITFIKRNEQFCELFHFVFNKERAQVMNYYVNHIDYLKAFIVYFKDKASEVIKDAERHKIKCSKNKFLTKIKSVPIKSEADIFLKKININKFYLGDITKNVYLNKREAECLYFILCRKPSKVIGQYLGISPRTVESYVDKLKIKLRASNIRDLISKATQQKFLESFPGILFDRFWGLDEQR